ncbi:MarR family transcriptional regulator [Gemmatimonas aurantiaca]|uniref:MarR family winged helix-turn-helix transcriptional regulator n=1 Tax=Gemmatimonas aurantiaca TaxID=173480 RepID=UPI00301C7404
MATITQPISEGAAQGHSEAHEPDVDATTLSALRLWVIMNRAQSAVTAHAAADVARHGLTLAEFGILEALYHRGPMLLGEVQRRILVSSGGITFLVDRLTAKGLVERRTCDSDRRARYAALTEQGRDLVMQIFPAHARELARVMSGISLEDQRTATEILKIMGRAAAQMPPSDESQD